MAGNGAFLNGRWAITNRHCVHDPVSGLPFTRCRPCVPHYPARAQMVLELLFQSPAGLDKQRSVNRLVGNLQISILWRLCLEPARYLLWRPLKLQFTGNNPAQLAVR